MLASHPEWMLNQISPDLGIPIPSNRVMLYRSRRRTLTSTNLTYRLAAVTPPIASVHL